MLVLTKGCTWGYANRRAWTLSSFCSLQWHFTHLCASAVFFSGLSVQQICVLPTQLPFDSPVCFKCMSVCMSIVSTETTDLCPFIKSKIKLFNQAFLISELKRALGLVARHLQPCSFNLVDHFILTRCCTTWMNEINPAVTGCVLLVHYYHLETCR